MLATSLLWLMPKQPGQGVSEHRFKLRQGSKLHFRKRERVSLQTLVNFEDVDFECKMIHKM